MELESDFSINVKYVNGGKSILLWTEIGGEPITDEPTIVDNGNAAAEYFMDELNILDPNARFELTEKGKKYLDELLKLDQDGC